MLHTVKKWKIIVLIYADFIDENKGTPKLNTELLEELNSMLGDFVNCKLDDKYLNIYIILSSVNYMHSTSDQIYELRNMTFIYKVEPGERMNDIICFEDVDMLSFVEGEHIRDDFEIQTTQKIAEAFRKAKQNITDDSSIMVLTWDHGSAFGIFREEEHLGVRRMSGWEDIRKREDLKYINLFLNESERYLHKHKKAFWLDDKPSVLLNLKNTLFYIKENSSENFDKIINRVNNGDMAGGFAIDTEGGHSYLGLLSNKDTFMRRNYPENIKHAEFIEMNYSEKVEIEIAGTQEILTNKELADAIKMGLESADVLLMMNCAMMNLHTIFTLKDQVYYFIAPEGVISSPGYNYRDITNYLMNQLKLTGVVTPEALSEQCVNTCSNIHAQQKAVSLHVDPSRLEEWSIFGIDIREGESAYMKYLETILAGLNDLAKTLIDELQNNGSDQFLLCARNLCFDFSSNIYYMIDIFHWMKNIEMGGYGILPSHVKPQLSDLLFLIGSGNGDRASLYYSKKGKLYGIKSSGVVTSHEQSGLAIFFPYLKLERLNIPFLKLDQDQLLTQKLNNWVPFLNKLTENVIG